MIFSYSALKNTELFILNSSNLETIVLLLV